MSAIDQQVMTALGTVIEPELNRDIVSLNMVRDLQVTNGTAAFTIVLTTPACPLKDVFVERCKRRLDRSRAGHPACANQLGRPSPDRPPRAWTAGCANE